jgi:aminopeptidase 2
VPIEESYNFALNLPKETDPLVLADLLGYFYSPHDYMTGASKLPYERLIRHMVGPLKLKMGWNEKADETEADKRLRISVLNILGTYGQDKETIKEARDLFEKYRKDHQSVGVNITDVVFDIVAYNGGIKEYEEMLALYRAAQNPEDKNRALFILSHFRNDQLAKRTLAFAMSKEVRLQDGLSVISGVAAQKETRAVGWPYIKEHWAAIVARFPENRLKSLTHAGATVETRAQEADVRNWFAAHPIPKAQSGIARMNEGMNLRLLRKERYGARIKSWTLAQAAKIPADAK